jgi:hypothetical protein
MRRTVSALLAAALTLACATQASAAEVFVTKDAQGRPIYTDRPESLPAQKVNVATKQTDVVEVPGRAQQAPQASSPQNPAAADPARQAAEAKQAQELTAADKAKRCQDARERYQNVMNARRLYEPGSTPDERRYLDSAEIDAARENAKQVMDEFCAGQ